MKLVDKALEYSDVPPEEVMEAACPGDLFPHLTGMELCIGLPTTKELCRECWNQEVTGAKEVA